MNGSARSLLHSLKDCLVKRFSPALFLILLALASRSATAQKTPTLPSLTTEVAFPNLQFDRPVSLDAPNDDSNLLFVVEQHQAKIW